MPIFDQNGIVVPVDAPAVTPPIIETASVYQNTNSRVTITPHIEGDTWVVEYYGRVIGDMDPTTLDTDIDNPSLIQYQLIKNMEIRVTGILSQTTDPETQTTVVTGTANMYPIVIPIVGDVFLAPVGDGTFAKFAITSTERKSIFKETAWEIEYTQSSYVTELILEQLNDKVVQTLIFDLKGLDRPGGALATRSEWDREVTRTRMISDMINRYYEEFYHPTERTFLVPNSIYLIYDPYLVEFWNFTIGKELSGGKKSPHQYDYKSAIFKTDYVTVWDAITRQNRSVLNRAVHSMRELATSAFQLAYINFTMHSSGLDKIINPTEVGGLAVIGGTDDIIDPLPPYIFSAEFYANAETGQTAFEIQLQKVINKTILSFSDLTPFYDELDDITPLERFYRIPLLITMMRVSR